VLTVSPQAEREQIERLQSWRGARDERAVSAALRELRAAASENRNIMPASIACAKAGVTTGEWGFALREGLASTGRPPGSGRPCAMKPSVSTICAHG
jgi:(2R)-ethylmalonyl-CoA mutase